MKPEVKSGGNRTKSRRRRQRTGNTVGGEKIPAGVGELPGSNEGTAEGAYSSVSTEPVSSATQDGGEASGDTRS